MAISDKNILLRGFSGKFGNQAVLRQRGNKTILANVPSPRKSKPTGKQRASCDDFGDAVNWARFTVKDPVKAAKYNAKATGLQSGYNVAIADYRRPPKVTGINCHSYHGHPDEMILVTATDVFEVKIVTLQIINAMGKIIESGPCVPDPSGAYWQYITTNELETTETVTIKAIAYDNPGHHGEMVVTK
jgi:hypothetical protein